MIKVLNLYAGIGGNRKLWKDVEVTAVEINPDIAKIYQDFFPQDKVVVGDAHKYLLEHFQEYDFIWSSPPCPSHSRMRFLKKEQDESLIYPDMNLWQEILFLKTWCKTKWVVENVITYYEPLIKPYEVGRHYFWSNVIISKKRIDTAKIRNSAGRLLKHRMKEHEFYIQNWYNYKGDKRTLLLNCVEPILGSHVFKCVFKETQKVLS